MAGSLSAAVPPERPCRLSRTLRAGGRLAAKATRLSLPQFSRRFGLESGRGAA